MTSVTAGQSASGATMEWRHKPVADPLSTGNSLRIAPARDGLQAACFWKFWRSGNEVYATCRSFGDYAKISVHASGQIHMRYRGKHRQELAQPLILGEGNWLHAVELRFLLSVDASPPPADNLRGAKGFLIDVPTGAMLVLNLLIAQVDSPSPTSLPHEFLPAACPLWRTLRKDKRSVVLIARVLPIDEQSDAAIKFLRQQLQPHVNLPTAQSILPYVEVRHVFWDPAGGNVLLIVPMGKESCRLQSGIVRGNLARGSATPRAIEIASPSASIQIIAPNGSVVATLSFDGASEHVVLTKGSEVRARLGRLLLSIDPSNLMWGESFQTPPILCSCVPTIDGAQPRSWVYTIFATFDGASLTADVRQLSAGLRNSNLSAPMSNIEPTEELVLSAPAGGLMLRSTKAVPESSAVLEMSVLLQDV